MHLFSQCSFISSHFAPKPKKQLVFPRKKVPDKSHYFDCFHCKKAKIYTSQRKDTRHTQSQHKAVGCQLLLKKPWADEYNIACRVSMLCSAAHVILENQLTITCLAIQRWHSYHYPLTLIINPGLNQQPSFTGSYWALW